jgi:hypothetical protein
MKRRASAPRIVLVVAALLPTACGTFGGVCNPTVDYPADDPCYRGPPAHHQTGLHCDPKVDYPRKDACYRGPRSQDNEPFK